METGGQPFRILEDRRVFVDYGPVSMVITAKKGGEMLPQLAAESFGVIEGALAALGEALPVLKRFPQEIRKEHLSGIPGKMLEAVTLAGEPTLTPMAAVAGAVSDCVADWIAGQGATKVIVNNGGDIALRLQGDETVVMGLLPDIQKGEVEDFVTIRAEDGIGGVCTSGLGGRSFTRGIANAVSVFSGRCIIADALATHIANVSCVQSARVHTKRAGEIDPGSDIRELAVVTRVEPLSAEEIQSGLKQMEQEMGRQKEKGLLVKAAADIQGHKLYVGF